MGVSDAIRRMIDAGLTVEQALLAAQICESELVPKKSSGALRTQRWREKKASQRVTSDVCDGSDACDAPPNGFPPDPLSLTPKENPPKGGQKKGAKREDFERFKAAYPHRKGSNPSEPAWQRFQAAVRSGTDPEQIIAAAGRYAAEQAGLGKAGTEFVKQMAPWLNQKCWLDYPEVDATAPVVVAGQVKVRRDDDRWDWFSARYRRDKGRGPPIADDGWYFPEEWLGEFERASGQEREEAA